MAEELRELRISKNLPAKEMVEVVRGIYPKYDKTMQSKCERGNEYGIQIKQDAMNALLAKFAPELLNAKKKNDGHRLTSRISCRLEDEEYKALKEIIKEDGFDTMQEWLASKIRAFIKNKLKGAKPL